MHTSVLIDSRKIAEPHSSSHFYQKIEDGALPECQSNRRMPWTRRLKPYTEEADTRFGCPCFAIFESEPALITLCFDLLMLCQACYVVQLSLVPDITMLLKYTLLFPTIYITCGRAVSTLPLACPGNLEPLPSPTLNLTLSSLVGTQSGQDSTSHLLPNPPNPYEIDIRGSGTRVRFGHYGPEILVSNLNAAIADILWATTRCAITNRSDSLVPIDTPFQHLNNGIEITLKTIAASGPLQLKMSQVADALLAMQVLSRTFRMLSSRVEIWSGIHVVGMGYVLVRASMLDQAAGSATGIANVSVS